MDICKENVYNVITKESKTVMEEKNEGLPKVEMEDILTGAKEELNPFSLVANSKEILSKFESGDLSGNQWDSGLYKNFFGMEGND
eukprot:7854467-Ditylum_brightwellii.AAC.1